jgi:hypothetical protein
MSALGPRPRPSIGPDDARFWAGVGHAFRLPPFVPAGDEE